MNPNYLEYDPSAPKEYAKNQSYYTSYIDLPYRQSFVHLIGNMSYQAYKKKDLEKVLCHRTYRFVNRFNRLVDLIEEGKKEGYIGNYAKKIISYSSGKKRVVFDPNPKFKILLQQFAKVLETVCFTEFDPRYKTYRVDKFTLVYKAYNLYKNKRIIPYRFILPHKLSIDNVLTKMSIEIHKSFTPLIIKLDLKDAYRSTSIDIVKKLIGKKLDKVQVIYDFIMENIDMCFIDGKLPPGYPTSSVLFNFVKDSMLDRFKDRKGYIRSINSYADDIYILADQTKGITEYTDQDRKNIIRYFIKYIRKWGYRINSKKTDYIEVFDSVRKKTTHMIGYPDKRILSSKMKSYRILGKILKIDLKTSKDVSLMRWEGSNKEKNKLRMLNYILSKEQKSNGSQVDPTKDNIPMLETKIKSFKGFYFVEPGDITYA